jgi:pimeloyl-ACP methyl ester carboxylesterase
MFRDPATTRFWIRLYRNALHSILGTSLPPVLRSLLTSSRTSLQPQSGSAYQLPFRIIWGAQDTFCPLWVGRAIEDRLMGLGAEVEFIEVEDSGHFVTEEQPAEVAGLLGGWLETRAAEG